LHRLVFHPSSILTPPPLPHRLCSLAETQSTFYQPDENTIFNFTKLGHLSSLFLAEVAGVPGGVLRELIELCEEDRPLRGDGWDGRRLTDAVNIFCQRVDGVRPSPLPFHRSLRRRWTADATCEFGRGQFLVNSAMNLGQNRPRSKRLAGKGTLQWEELYQEVRIPSPSLPAPAAILVFQNL
jgi:hypothetical protein